MLANLELEFECFTSDDLRVHLLRGVLSHLNGAPQVRAHGGLGGLLAEVPQMPAGAGVGEAGSAIAEVAGHLDGGELYTGVAIPARTALSLYDAHMEWAPGINDLEDEHGLDAVSRLVGLGLVAEGLSELDSDGAAQEWVGTESGRAALAWFAAVEVVIAFSTEDDPVDGDRVLALLDSFFDDAIEAWAELASERALARARIIVNNWTDVICPAVNAAQEHIGAIADALRSALQAESGADVDALAAEAQRVGLYRALVARHLGERLHGELTPQGSAVEPDEPAVDTGPDVADLHTEPESTVGDELIASVEGDEDCAERVAELTERVGGAQARLATQRSSLAETRTDLQQLDSKLSAVESSVGEQVTQRADLQARIRDINAERRKAAKSGNKGDKAVDDKAAALTSSAEGLSQAESKVAEALEHCAGAKELLGAAEASSGAAAAEIRLGIETQLAAWRTVRVANQRLLTLLTAGEDLERIEGIDSQLEALKVERSQRKSSLAELRKRRRSVSRATQSAAASQGAAQDRVSHLKGEIETQAVAKEQRRGELQEYRRQLSASENKFRKRLHRVDELEDRQVGADDLVTELTDGIAQTRGLLEGVLRQVNAGQQELKALRLERRKFIRRRLASLRGDRDALQTKLGPFVDASAGTAGLLSEKSETLDAAKAVADSRHSELKAVKAARRQAGRRREKGIRLAEAALDMMRKNAMRLEDAHDVLREKQARFDAIGKEQNLLHGRLEKLDADIVNAQSLEAKTADQIKHLEEAVSQSKSAIGRHDGKVARARAKAAEVAATRAIAVQAEIRTKRERIDALRSQVADAIDDRNGLAVAEVRVDSAQDRLRKSRVPIAGKLREIKKKRDADSSGVGKVQKMLGTRQKQLLKLDAEIEGQQLTIRALIADRATRQKKQSSARDRIRHLSAVVVQQREAEDDAVERVADFQSWVDRTEAAIAKLDKPRAAVRVPPPPKVAKTPRGSGVPKVSKVDSLLANLTHKSEEAVPDPAAVPEVDGAATVMLERSSLLPPEPVNEQQQRPSQSDHASELDAATEMFSPEDLRKRLEEEEHEEATVMMPRGTRLPSPDREEE